MSHVYDALNSIVKSRNKIKLLFFCDFSWEGQLQLYTFPGPMRSNPVKDNPIGSAVGEILQYKQTDRQTHILLLYYKDDAGNGHRF